MPQELQWQLDWIKNVLASRGMPSIMLEKTLQRLHAELVAAVPEQQVHYHGVLAAADRLRAARTACLADERTGELCRQFDRAVGIDLAEKYPDAGPLLVSAVADTFSGIEAALPSLHKFLTDEEHFPSQWIAAVNALVAGLKQAAVSPGMETVDDRSPTFEMAVSGEADRSDTWAVTLKR